MFLAVGNIKPEKGFEDLLRAVSILRERRGKKDFVVLIAGGVSDEPYSRLLHETAERFDIADTVRFLGYRADTGDLSLRLGCVCPLQP